MPRITNAQASRSHAVEQLSLPFEAYVAISNTEAPPQLEAGAFTANVSTQANTGLLITNNGVDTTATSSTSAMMAANFSPSSLDGGAQRAVANYADWYHRFVDAYEHELLAGGKKRNARIEYARTLGQAKLRRLSAAVHVRNPSEARKLAPRT